MKRVLAKKRIRRALAVLLSSLMVASWVCEGATGMMVAHAEETVAEEMVAEEMVVEEQSADELILEEQFAEEPIIADSETVETEVVAAGDENNPIVDLSYDMDTNGGYPVLYRMPGEQDISDKVYSYKVDLVYSNGSTSQLSIGRGHIFLTEDGKDIPNASNLLKDFVGTINVRILAIKDYFGQEYSITIPVEFKDFAGMKNDATPLALDEVVYSRNVLDNYYKMELEKGAVYTFVPEANAVSVQCYAEDGTEVNLPHLYNDEFSVDEDGTYYFRTNSFDASGIFGIRKIADATPKISIDGKEVEAILSWDVPNSVLYAGVDRISEAKRYIRVQVKYADGTTEYLYNRYVNGYLHRFVNGKYVETDAMFDSTFYSRIYDGTKPCSYGDKEGNRYEYVYSDTSVAGEYYILLEIRVGGKTYTKDTLVPISIVDPQSVTDVVTVTRTDFGTEVSYQTEPIYDDGTQIARSRLIKIEGVNYQYTYMYWNSYNDNRGHLVSTATGSFYMDVDAGEYYFRSVAENVYDNRQSIKVTEFPPVKSAKYILPEGKVLEYYFAGAVGSIEEYSARIYVEYEDGSSRRYRLGDSEIGHLNWGVVDICTVDGRSVDRDNPLEAGDYYYTIRLETFRDRDGNCIEFNVPFVLRETEEIENYAIPFKVGDTITVDESNRYGGSIFLKMYFEEGEEYIFDTNAKYSGIFYDSDYKYMYMFDMMARPRSYAVEKSGYYYYQLAYFSNGDPFDISLTKDNDIKNVTYDDSVGYIDKVYKGISGYYGLFGFYPKGVALNIEYDNGTSEEVHYDCGEEFNEFVNKHPMYLGYASLDKKDIDFPSEPGSYYYKIAFDGSEPVYVPFELLDPAETPVLELNNRVSIGKSTLYGGGVPNVYKVNLEEGKSYKFKTDDRGIFMSLWDEQGNEVGEPLSVTVGDTIYTSSRNSMTYSATITGTYYICLENPYDEDLVFWYEEYDKIVDIKVVDRGTIPIYMYEKLELDAYPSGVQFEVTYESGKVSNWLHSNVGHPMVKEIYVIDSNGNRYWGMRNLPVGEYYQVFEIEDYDDLIKVPFTVRSLSEAPVFDLNNTLCLTSGVAVYKINLDAEKSYLFSTVEHNGDERYGYYAHIEVYNSDVEIVRSRVDMFWAGYQYPVLVYRNRYIFSPESDGCYYVVVVCNKAQEYEFTVSEIPEIVSAEIISQPSKKEFCFGAERCNEKWFYGLEVKLAYSDGSMKVARYDEFAEYGINASLHHDDDSNKAPVELYEDCSVGTYRGHISVAGLGTALLTDVITVKEPKGQKISLGQSIYTPKNYDPAEYEILDVTYTYNKALPSVYEITIDEKCNINIESTVPMDVTLIDTNRAMMVANTQKCTNVIYEVEPGQYSIVITNQQQTGMLTVKKLSKIAAVEVVRQPLMAGKTIDVSAGADYQFRATDMRLKLTFTDGSVIYSEYMDYIWMNVVKCTDIVDSNGNKLNSYEYGLFICNINVSESTDARFRLELQPSISNIAAVESADFSLAVNDIVTLTAGSSYSKEVDYSGGKYFYLETQEGKNYDIKMTGCTYFDVSRVKARGDFQGEYIGGDKDYESCNTGLRIDGIDEADGIYLIYADFAGDYSVTVREATETIEYKGMSISLVEGYAKVNTYFAISGNVDLVDIEVDGYGHAERSNSPVTVSGISGEVWCYSYVVSLEELNDDALIFVEYDGIFDKKIGVSPVEYAQKIIENKDNNPEYAKAKALVNAMLCYGGYMERYFGKSSFYDVNMISATTTDRAGSAEAISDINVNAASYTNSDSFTYIGSSLVLHENVSVHVYMAYDSSIASFDAYNITVNGRTYNLGEAIRTDIEGIRVQDYNGYLRVVISGIGICDIASTNDISISKIGKGSDTARVRYSAMNYIEEVLTSGKYSASLVMLCRALYFYYDEAVKYTA